MSKKILSWVGVLMLTIVGFSGNGYAAPTVELQKILFVCGGNTGRSVMAEGLANHKYAFAQQGYIAMSRGVNVNPKEVLPEWDAVKVMAEEGIDIQGHRAKSVTIQDIDSAVLILAMTQEHQKKLIALNPKAAAKIKLLSEYTTGLVQDVDDAYGHNLSFYFKVRDQIDAYVKEVLAAIHGVSQ